MKWINSNDRLPNEKEIEISMLVLSPYVEDTIDKAYYYDGKWWSLNDGDEVHGVSHWMHLPDLPDEMKLKAE